MLEEAREMQLVEEAQKGDRAALEALFADSRERLLGAIRLRLGPAVRNQVEDEDVLQDTFTRALGSVDRFEWQGPGSFRRWLESIATHVALDAVRRQGYRRVLRLEEDVRGGDASPSRHLRRKERLERLRRSLGTLSPEHQSVLRLSRMEGLSIKEIAERLGRSESAIKNLLLRATRQLRAAFGDTESLSLEGFGLESEGPENLGSVSESPVSESPGSARPESPRGEGLGLEGHRPEGERAKRGDLDRPQRDAEGGADGR